MIAGQCIIITGASSGIGAATAVACAEAGMNIVIHGRRREQLSRVASAVRARGREVEMVEGDVTHEHVNRTMIDAAQAKFGGFYAVFANAGYGAYHTMHEMPEGELRRMFDVNFFAGASLLQLAARALIAAGKPGHLLMCSSALAKFTLPKFAAYSATKAAQNHVCRAMANELAPHRIRVSSVHPVTTRTDFFDTAAALSAGRREFDPPASMIQPPERVARAVVRCLIRPRAEVWTSVGARVFAGLGTIFPSLFDSFARLAQKR
ncbi:MAG: SDR family oxidoreductase [Phycisphaerales bacterium]|nr:SDR family oxidoreductase [Phycisphaerales bacterium]